MHFPRLLRTRAILLWPLCLVAILLWPALAAAKDDILPLKDVQVGMKGIGKTVIHGREIETFNVEVMGILSNNKINENLLINGKSILVKVSGKVIEEAGGIAAGMSGSPVYVNGRLIGGLSSGWVMTDHTVGMVTPIEEMLEIWDYPLFSRIPQPGAEPEIWTSPTNIRLGNREFCSVRVIDQTELEPTPLPSNEAVFVRVATPVFIQGLTEKAANVLRARFRTKNLQTTPGNPSPMPPSITGPAPTTGSKDASVHPVEPGSAIGVQLARGDINLSTLGTLTYRDGKKILAFAHPFLKKGNVSYLLTGAHIYHSFSSVQMPFKIGAPTEILGSITQDREKGISGEIGRFPIMIPVQIEMIDKDLKRSRSLNFQVVRDPSVLLDVVESTFVQGMEGVIDRNGEGTAKIGLSIECAGVSGSKYEFRREDMFYSRNEIIATLIGEINHALSLISESELEEVYPTKIACRIEIEQQRRTMAIEKVEVKNTSITPGGVLEVWVTLRPYREKSIVRKARIAIPNEIGKEDLRLTVYGLSNRSEEVSHGGSENPEGKRSKDLKTDEPVHESFEAMMREWASGPQNSDLLFQLTQVGDDEKKIKLNGRDVEIQQTNMVVLGSIDSTITLSED
jgi:hypothetical protein